MDDHTRALVTKPASLPRTCDAKSVRAALADRMFLSEAIEAVGKLVDQWPDGGKNAGKSYLGALAAVLCAYPRMVAAQACDPIKGIARETKFLPTVADLIGYCERETESLRGPVDREDRDAMLRRQAEARVEEADRWAKLRPTRETLDELRAKHGPNWGIKQPADDKGAKRRQLETIQKGNDRALAQMDGTVSAGIPITAALIATLRRPE